MKKRVVLKAAYSVPTETTETPDQPAAGKQSYMVRTGPLKSPVTPCYKCGKTEFTTDNPDASVVVFTCVGCKSLKPIIQQTEKRDIPSATHDHPLPVQPEASPEEQGDGEGRSS